MDVSARFQKRLYEEQSEAASRQLCTQQLRPQEGKEIHRKLRVGQGAITAPYDQLQKPKAKTQRSGPAEDAFGLNSEN